MNVKKSKGADLEKLRTPMVIMGLAVAASVTLAATEYLSHDVVTKKKKQVLDDIQDEIIDVPILETTPPPPPPAQAPPPQIEDIVEVEDDEVVEEVELVIQDQDDEIVTFTPPPPDDEPPAKVEIYEIAQVQPEFPGGEEALYKFLGENLKYPPIARESSIQGRVYVQFVVWSDGSIRDVTVLRGIGGGCDEEAVRVVKMMPNWKPGEQMGKSVPVRYRLPIKFTLS
jgi:protein TonB